MIRLPECLVKVTGIAALGLVLLMLPAAPARAQYMGYGGYYGYGYPGFGYGYGYPGFAYGYGYPGFGYGYGYPGVGYGYAGYGLGYPARATPTATPAWATRTATPASATATAASASGLPTPTAGLTARESPDQFRLVQPAVRPGADAAGGPERADGERDHARLGCTTPDIAAIGPDLPYKKAAPHAGSKPRSRRSCVCCSESWLSLCSCSLASCASSAWVASSSRRRESICPRTAASTKESSRRLRPRSRLGRARARPSPGAPFPPRGPHQDIAPGGVDVGERDARVAQDQLADLIGVLRPARLDDGQGDGCARPPG